MRTAPSRTTDLPAFLRADLARPAHEPFVLDRPVPVEALPTPALVVDLDVFERNLEAMQRHVDQAGMGLRCHTKMHKCPHIAERQVEAGAIGVCTATVSEAEVMVSSGIEQVLITSPVVTLDKVERVAAARGQSAGVMIVVDSRLGADRLQEAVAEHGLNMAVILDVDPIMGRTGVPLGDAALGLARYIGDRCPALQLTGMQYYAGHCMHVSGHSERKARYGEVMARGAETFDLLSDAGFDLAVFTGGGTGTFDLEPDLGHLTDIQAGSYLFMDVEYRAIGGESTELFEAFEPSLFVLTTAISQRQSEYITVDAGIKAFATDTVAPMPRALEGARFHFAGDEHGVVDQSATEAPLALGDVLEMVVSHCDPTVNLYDCYFAYRDRMVTEIWPITARGRSQ